ncbi:prepilin-type N-terminal cleavage/methylation domain-containing protein [Solibacillus faecavium]|uniref:prepilin-type N-terminal cleavage/methylation domain-containing protein n=1 Tax=Solibacillus faecavium TaxID=2762221 RepID=UPI001CD8DB32|nr:prepilin-type N-terminal cleavage/methylation domain-containing protein [Solibacillus faecavium]
MFKTLKKRIKNEKGLSLVELLAVIVILAIVAAIAIPAIGNIIDNSRIKAAKADVANVLSGANIYFTDETSAGVSADKTKLAPYVDSWGVLSQTTVTGITVTKGTTTTSGTTPTTLTVTGTVKVGNKTVTIKDATIDNLKVDSKEKTTSFTWSD